MNDDTPPSNHQLGISSELLRWLRMLVLPVWARIIVFGMMIVVVVGGLTMLVYGVWVQKDDIASRAMQLITLSLPVLVIILALVFGQNNDARLRQLTHKLIDQDLPNTLKTHIGDDLLIHKNIRGCCALYQLRSRSDSTDQHDFFFQLELNVYKVNIVLEAPPHAEGTSLEHPSLGAFAHAIQGAVAEGYARNPNLGSLQRFDQSRHSAVTLFRTLPKDFLLDPAQRLYFLQDLCFFIASLWQIQMEPPLSTAAAVQPDCDKTETSPPKDAAIA